MPFDEFNKKQTVDFVDEDLKELGIWYLILKFLLPVIVWLIGLGIILFIIYWCLKIAIFNGIIPPLYI